MFHLVEVVYPLLHGSELHQQLLHPVRLLGQLGPHDVSLDSLVNLHMNTGLLAAGTLNKYGDYCEKIVGSLGNTGRSVKAGVV